MTSLSDFLPPLYDTSGDTENVIERLYEVFCRDFIDAPVLHDGFVVEFDDRCINEGKVEAFWHLTHCAYERGRGRQDALFDHDRARRLGWIKPVIQNSNDALVVRFDHRDALRGGNRGGIRRYLWYKAGKFYVVLQLVARQSRRPVYRLITANYLDFFGKEKDLQQKYENRIR